MKGENCMKKIFSGMLSILLAASFSGCAAPAEDLMKNVTPNPVYARELISVSDTALSVSSAANTLLPTACVASMNDEKSETMLILTLNKHPMALRTVLGL
jgi:hypothetical protein